MPIGSPVDEVQRVLAQAAGASASACSRGTSSVAATPERHGAILTFMGAARLGREVKTLDHAWREFRSNRSPKIIAGAIVARAALRISLGDFTWRDAVAAVAMLVVYPFGEWAIHVYLLHMKPFRFRGRRVELPSSSAHREHHERPNYLGLILLAPLEAAALLLLAVPVVLAVLLARACRFAALDHRRVRRLRPDRHLRVDALPDPHRLPPALTHLQGDLAKPPPASLQERALLARHHEHRRRPRAAARRRIRGTCRARAPRARSSRCSRPRRSAPRGRAPRRSGRRCGPGSSGRARRR